MKLSIAIILCFLCTGTAMALSVADSKHNLSTTGVGVHSTTVTQVCIFCHSPHNAMGGTSLWARQLPDPSSFELYLASPTLTPAALSAQFDSSNVSLLCLSCHGGTLENLGPDMVDPNGTWSKSGVNWDGKTPVNHPVGFDYALAQSQNPTKLGTPLQVSAALGSSNVFLRSSLTGTNYSSMECSTCHLVHDNANPPFLRIANANNAFCLACHIDKKY